MRELTVGLVFFALVGLLLGVTMWVNGPASLFGGPAYAQTVRFDQVSGLTVGNPVWVRGAESGKVTDIALDGDGGVVVDLALDVDPGLKSDAKIEIKAGSALGGMVVAIDPGKAADPHPPGVIAGRYRTSGFDNVGEQIGDSVREFGKKFDIPLENIRLLTDEALKGEGLLGALLKDKELRDRVVRISEDVETFTSDLAAGEGTLGKLINDRELYDKIDRSATRLDEWTAKLDGGGGVLDVLMNDKELGDRVDRLLANLESVSTTLDEDLGTASTNLRAITDDLRAGKGLLGKLIYDEKLSNRVDRISKDIAQVTGKLARGEGTLGKLIQDDALYADLRESLDALIAGAGDARENAPILTFAGFLFGGF